MIATLDQTMQRYDIQGIAYSTRWVVERLSWVLALDVGAGT